MTFRIAETGRNVGLDSTFDRADTGGHGSIKIYTGSQPATADTSPTGTLLVTLELNTPAFNAASGGVKQINLATAISANAIANGTAGWARLTNGAGQSVCDGNVATSGGDFTINTTSIISGQTVVLLGGTITDPV